MHQPLILSTTPETCKSVAEEPTYITYGSLIIQLLRAIVYLYAEDTGCGYSQGQCTHPGASSRFNYNSTVKQVCISIHLTLRLVVNLCQDLQSCVKLLDSVCSSCCQKSRIELGTVPVGSSLQALAQVLLFFLMSQQHVDISIQATAPRVEPLGTPLGTPS